MPTIDGMGMEKGTADVYCNCLGKACHGDHKNFKNYESWAKKDGFFENPKETVSLQTVSKYMTAAAHFVSFLQRTKGLPSSMKDANANLVRWASSLRKGKQRERMMHVQKKKSVVPQIAAEMQQFSSSEDSR